jgi:phosphoribosylformylglycinamidine cyclo-ligase
MLPEGLAARIDLDRLQTPPVFVWLARAGGIAEAEMLRTFNCGVGMICVIAEAEAERLVAHLYDQGERTAIIGKITERGAEPVTFQGKLGL